MVIRRDVVDVNPTDMTIIQEAISSIFVPILTVLKTCRGDFLKSRYLQMCLQNADKP